MSEVNLKRRSRRRHKGSGNRKWPLVLICLFAMALVGAGGMTAYRAKRAAPVVPGLPEEIQVSQVLVRQNINEDFKSNFSPPEETTVEHLPESKTRVSGWVDVVNATGASDRQNFTIVIFRNDVGDWVGEKISIMPQM